MEDYDKIQNFLEEVKQKDIIFKDHFKMRMTERPLSDEMVRKNIKNVSNLLKVEKQHSKVKEHEKYKIWIKLSSKYNLILVISIHKEKLYIITGWNSDRKWQK